MSSIKKKNGDVINIKDIQCLEIKKNEILVFEVDEYFKHNRANEVKDYLRMLSKKLGIEINIIFKTPTIKKIYKIRKERKWKNGKQ